MTSFSSYFRLNLTQAQLDFVDIDVEKDTPLFVDPYALSIQDDAWSIVCTDHVVSFFQFIIDCIRNGDEDKGRKRLNHLTEPNETCLGFSKGKPSGRGVGKKQGSDIFGALARSEVAKSGELHDLADTALFVMGVGPDKISDITTNVIRRQLVEYTQSQCKLHDIPVRIQTALPPCWDANELRWKAERFDVPVVDNRPILLVPKSAVRMHVGLDSQEFYNKYMLEILKAEHLNANDSLVEVLKDGKRKRVTKKKLKEKYPFDKDGIFRFVQSHPDVLEAYKSVKGAEGSPTAQDLAKDFDSMAFARALSTEFRKIPPGKKDADRFHKFIVGVLTFLFYPSLTIPNIEHSIHGGRKRIDVTFVNTGKRSFFDRVRTNQQTIANYLVVECKNYRGEISNPELDQLSGRFSPSRGKLGFLICRNFDDRKKFVERCRDTVKDDRGYVIPLADADLIRMLDSVANGNSLRINELLETRLLEISS